MMATVQPTPNPSSAHILVTEVVENTKKSAQIQILPISGTVLNHEAPWQLTAHWPQSKPLEYTLKDFDFQKNVFRVPFPNSTVTLSDLKFKVVYFVCNTTKTWCKRLIHEQNFK